MEQEGITKEYILGNFRFLPRDVLKLIINNLSPQDTRSLCLSSPEFNEWCNKNKIFDDTARKLLLREAPLSELLDTPQKQLDAIRRGQVTTYNIKFDEGTKFTMNDEDSGIIMGELRDSHLQFYIKGSPPPEGTKVWLFGYIDDYFQYSFGHRIRVYINKDDWQSDNTIDSPNYVFKENIERYSDKIKINIYELIARALKDLDDDGYTEGDGLYFFLRQVQLP